MRERLRDDHGFLWLWLGQTVSQVAEQSVQVLLPLTAVLTLHVGAAQLGLLRAVGQLPVLLVSLFAGVWVDRRSTRAVMTATDGARALLLGAVAVAAASGRLGLPVLFAAVFAVGALSVLFDVAYQASVVRLVREPLRLRATGALESSRSAAQIAGPAVGGGLVALPAPAWAIGTGALAFVLSAVALRRVRREEVAAPGAEAGLLREIREGLRCVASHPLLRTLALATAVFQFVFAAVTTVYLLFLPRELHLSAGAVGLVLAASGVGALAGSALAAPLAARVGIVGAATAGDCAMLCAPALRGASALTVAALVLIGLVFGAAGQVVNVAMVAMRQSATPLRLQARVAATITFLGLGLAPAGALAGGALAQAWGLRAALFAASACLLLCPAIMFRSRSRLHNPGAATPSLRPGPAS